MSTRFFLKCCVAEDHSFLLQTRRFLVTELNKFFLVPVYHSCQISLPVSEIAPLFLFFQRNPCQTQCHGQGHSQLWNHHISAPTPFWWYWGTGHILLTRPASCLPSGVLLASFPNSYLQEPSHRQFAVLGRWIGRRQFGHYLGSLLII